jgi:hypothetical protein
MEGWKAFVQYRLFKWFIHNWQSLRSKANEIRLLVSRQRPQVILAPHQKVSLLSKFHYFAKKTGKIWRNLLPSKNFPFRLRSPCFTTTQHASRQCDLPVPHFQIAQVLSLWSRLDNIDRMLPALSSANSHADFCEVSFHAFMWNFPAPVRGFHFSFMRNNE